MDPNIFAWPATLDLPPSEPFIGWQRTDFESFGPISVRDERGLPNSGMEKRSIFPAQISGGKCSPVPFRAKFLRVCPEFREYADDSL
jgi:hypothetical protein